MDSGSGKHRRRSSNKHRSKHRASRAPSEGRSSRSPKPVSSTLAPAPSPSRAAIAFPVRKQAPAVWLGYLFGLLGVCALILLGGSHRAIALGFALILPGLALLIRPPKAGLGRWADCGVVALLGTLLLAFLPQFYWPMAEWRQVAVDDFGIELPAVLSVQPLISLEASLMALAGFAWLYAASAWEINATGRKYFFVVFSCMLAGFAGAVIWGNLHGLRYPGAEDSAAFSFFPNRNQTANFLALGGVVTFAFTMEGLRGRKVLHLVGVLSSLLCLMALIVSLGRSGVLLYFIGIGIWFLCRLRAKSVPVLVKIGLPLVLLAFSLVISSRSQSVERVADFVSTPSEWGQEYRALIYQDAFEMFKDAPVAGVGVGNFSAVFPQYREHSRSFQVARHPESDLIWLATELGLLGVVSIGIFLIGYFLRCRGLSLGRGGPYRVIAQVAVIVFLLHSLVDVSAHRPGTVYFAILLAALALPHSGAGSPTFRPVLWRGLGLVLFVIGGLWFLAGLTGAPFHSSTALALYEKQSASLADTGDYEGAIERIDEILALKPMRWQAYFQRAQLTFASSRTRAATASDFRNARFLEPTLGSFCVKEGFIWLPYDLGRALSAWREALFREIEFKDKAFLSMLNAGMRDPKVMEALVHLSKIDPHYRTMLFGYLREPLLMSEIRAELEVDPSLSGFSRDQRTSILTNWIEHGDLSSAEVYLSTYGGGLKDAWWLWSYLYKQQADFASAVNVIREALPVPEVPEAKVDPQTLTRLSREFAVMPQDIMKGTALLRVFLDAGELVRALEVTDSMLKGRKPPAYVYYWRAEILYRMDDLIESWYAFEAYVGFIRDEAY